MNIVSNSIAVYGASCWGCTHTQRDIMISVLQEPRPEIHDIFLTREQALQLIEDLARQVDEDYCKGLRRSPEPDK